ncbi:MAG: hypothetical protein WBL63_05995 [Candidatus Acidiferrum sp.]
MNLQANQGVIHPNPENDEEREDAQNDPTKHRLTSFGKIELLKSIFTIRAQSAGVKERAHDRILKVAQTIADLEAAPDIQAKHLSEAIQYRTLDRTYWS